MTTSISPEQTKPAPAPATTKARVAKRPAPVAPSKGKPGRKTPRTKKAASARGGSKTAKILDLLKRTGGVTLRELIWGRPVKSFFGAPSTAIVPAGAARGESCLGQNGAEQARVRQERSVPLPASTVVALRWFSLGGSAGIDSCW